MSGPLFVYGESAKASPFGRGVTAGDGEGKDADKEAGPVGQGRSDKEITYRCAAALW